jgi:D-amino-acid oxidase
MTGGLSRRAVLGGGGAAICGLVRGVSPAAAEGADFWSGMFGSGSGASRPAEVAKPRTIASRQLTVPGLLGEPGAVKFVAGVRPHRQGGARIELAPPIEIEGQRRYLVHNYGHGGAGISMAFGSAERVGDLLAELLHRDPSLRPDLAIAVLGGGIIGSSAAWTIRQRWPTVPVTIYAAETDPVRTTSWKAGGQFAFVSNLKEYESSQERSFAAQVLARSRAVMDRLGRSGRHARYGIVQRASYALDASSNDVRLNFGATSHLARTYQSWLLDPQRMLPAIRRDLQAGNVAVVSRRFNERRAIYALAERLVINCTGLGAGALFNDRALDGRRGHLIVLPNVNQTDYFLTGWCGNGETRYLFGRHDDVVIGGTNYVGASTTPDYDPEYGIDTSACRRLYRSTQALFSGNGRMCG